MLAAMPKQLLFRNSQTVIAKAKSCRVGHEYLHQVGSNGFAASMRFICKFVVGEPTSDIQGGQGSDSAVDSC